MIRSTAGRSQNLTAAAVEPRPIQLDLMTQLQYVALQRHVDALDRLVLLFQNLHRTRKRFSLHRIITSNTKSSKRPPAPESKAENIAVPQPPARSSMNCGILEMQKHGQIQAAAVVKADPIARPDGNRREESAGKN